MVIISRRGWDMDPLKTSKFVYKEELTDFSSVIKQIDEIYQSPIFLCGVSAGACHGTRLMATHGETLPIRAFCSISNPYNIGRLIYQFKKRFFGRYVSKFLCRESLKLYKFHSKNPNFKKRLIQNNFDFDQIMEKME